MKLSPIEWAALQEIVEEWVYEDHLRGEPSKRASYKLLEQVRARGCVGCAELWPMSDFTLYHIAPTGEQFLCRAAREGKE